MEDVRSHPPWSSEEEENLNNLFELCTCDRAFDTDWDPPQAEDGSNREEFSNHPVSSADPPSCGKMQTMQIQSRLQYVAKEGKARRMRISIPVFSVGITLLVFMIVLICLYYFLTTSSGTRDIFYTIIWCCAPLVLFFMLLTLLPSDTRFVPWIVYFCLFSFAAGGLGFASRLVTEYQNARVSSCVKTTLMDHIEEDIPCWVRWCIFGYFAITTFNIFFIVFCICLCVRRTWHKRSHDRSREFLDLLWWCQFSHNCVMGFGSFFYTFVVLTSGKYMHCLRDSSIAICTLGVGFLSFPQFGVRQRIQSWFASLGESTAVAAGVAELLGGRKAGDIVIAAKDSFSYICLELVANEDMAQNTPNKELSKLARKARLGEIDAFVSHSWHDPSDAKWKALQSWRGEFKDKNSGREPKLWIDKYCIDQNNVEESLVCLPVYLSACQRLLILCGESYLQRLWCLIEVFVFMHMGGKVENVEVRFLRAADKMGLVPSASLEQALEDFDPTIARCVSQYDTDRLHAVIEASSMGAQGIKAFVQNLFLGNRKGCAA